MLRRVFFLDHTGDILIDKQIDGRARREDFEIIKQFFLPGKPCPPIFETFGSVYLMNKVNDIAVVVACGKEMSSLFSSEIVAQLCNFIEQHLREPLTETKVKTDYHKIYEVIDQFLLFSFPFVPGIENIEELIPSPHNKPVSRWGFKEKMYVNIMITEYFDAFFDNTGHIMLMQIRGGLSIESKLASEQKVTLDITYPKTGNIFISYNELIPVAQRSKKSITITPPGCQVQLLSYIINSPKVQPPVFVRPIFRWGRWGVSFRLEARVGDVMSGCILAFDAPSGLGVPSMAASEGTATYDRERGRIMWELPALCETATLDGFLPGESVGKSEVAISATFRASGPPPSGLNVEVECSGHDDAVTKSVKYLTQSGRVEFSLHE